MKSYIQTLQVHMPSRMSLRAALTLFAVVFSLQLPAASFGKLTPPDGEIVRKVFKCSYLKQDMVVTDHDIYSWETDVFFGFHRHFYRCPADRRIVGTTVLRDNSLARYSDLFVLLDDGTIVIIDMYTMQETTALVETQISFEPFQQIESGASGGSGRSVHIDPIYVLSSAAVHVTRDSFASWQYDTAGLGSAYLYEMTADIHSNIYLATNQGLFFQDSITDAWSAVPAFAGASVTHVFSAQTGDMYASSSSTVYKSTDYGLTWNADTIGIQYINAVSFGDDSFGNMYAIMTSGYGGRSGNLIYRKWAGTSVWQRIGQSVNASLLDLANANMFNSITANGSDSLLALGTDYGFYASYDFGATWTARNNGLSAYTYSNMIFDATGRAYLGTGNGIFYHNYNDTVWTQCYPTTGLLGGQPVYNDNAGNLYTLGQQLDYTQIYSPRITMKSTDRGLTWLPDSLGITAVSTNFSASVWFTDESGVQHLAVYGGGSGPVSVWIKQAGQAWQADNTGFTTNNSAQPNLFGSDHAGNIYLACAGDTSNVCWRRTGTGPWSNISNGFQPYNAPYSFAPDHSGNMLAAAGAGIFKFNGTAWTQLPAPAFSGVSGGSNAYAVGVDDSDAVYTCYANFDIQYNDIGVDVFHTENLGTSWTNEGADSVTFLSFVSSGDSMYGLTYHDGIYIFSHSIPTGIGPTSVSNGTIKVYPNPSRSAFLIEAEGYPAGTCYVLRDLAGRSVLTGWLNGQATSVSVTSLAAGAYLLQTGGQFFKMIKE